MRFGLQPGSRSRFEGLAAELRPLILGRPGCGGATFVGDDAAGEGGVVLEVFVLSKETPLHFDLLPRTRGAPVVSNQAAPPAMSLGDRARA
ncbi:MAG: hypothetical protein M4D85_10455 [Actinomycetota bacterium]|nr:hypothetical protein [Actinomycetota bacterium]